MASSKTEELLPCPFCGSREAGISLCFEDADCVGDKHLLVAYVACDECLSKTQALGDIKHRGEDWEWEWEDVQQIVDEAVGKWNKRAN